MAVIQVGDNPASTSYVTGKQKACEEVGINCQVMKFPENVTEDVLIETIDSLNNDKMTNGILVQLPLPSHINVNRIMEEIDPIKDVDCFTPTNIGKYILGYNGDNILPCTPRGIISVLNHEFGKNLAGMNVVVLGRSSIVGRPIANILSQHPFNANVTIVHSKTPKEDLIRYCSNADIIISAVGKHGVVDLVHDFIDDTGDYHYCTLKEKLTIIDVGVNRIPDPEAKNGFRLVGDIYDRKDNDLNSFIYWNNIKITPVPGGIGPMTISSLLHNTVQLAYKQLDNNVKA